MTSDEFLGSSFRDPSGFVFRRDGNLLRQVNQSYQQDYLALMDSGLYRQAVEDGWLIPHQEVDSPLADPNSGWRLIRPLPVSFISYPYEWCFSQLKDAALATLAIQKKALQHGMSLKDASAYNLQFDHGRPILIDTLSFERYTPGQPWPAYGQACRHFLAPLALMSLRDIRLQQLWLANLDGIPLDLAAKLLPARSRLRLSLLVHLHWHAKMQRAKDAAAEKPPPSAELGITQLTGIIDNLESGIARLNWKPAGTEWADYYQESNYSPTAMDQKKSVVAQFIDTIAPKSVWDLGANTGEFSRLASDRGIFTVAFDKDPAAVEKNYLLVKERGEKNLLPLVMDLTNPSPALGWSHQERFSLVERGPADLVLALALIHHLAIGDNVPFDRVAKFLHRIGRNLIIEFVPQKDPQVRRLLVVRKDIFADYTQTAFETEFGRYFTIRRREPILQTPRTLYWMSRKETE
jgi:ribosomal protein L11 methylase PrmA